MRRIIDLSTPIKSGHFRWPVERKLLRSHEGGDGLQATWVGWGLHGFTHMDTPRHFNPEGFSTDAVSLDMVVGEAAVVDISGLGPEAAITEEAIAAAGGHVREGDIVLMRARWDTVESIDRPEFWTRAPYMTREACEWLLARKIKAIAFDFPQDYCIRDYVSGARKPALEENTTHITLLWNGVLMFEYLCNMSEISQQRPLFVGLPLMIPDRDGAPARVIVIEED